MFPNPMRDEFLQGKTSIDLSQPDDRLLSTKMLTFPWRSYVINKVKHPLQRAIEGAVRLAQVAPALLQAVSLMRSKFGSIDKARTIHPNTACLKDYKARFMAYENNPARVKLFEAAWDILIAEVEHDVYYSERLNVLVEWIIRDILNDQWLERVNGQPDRRYWKEPGEYGGKYSIIHKLKKHRHEILKIIGEETHE